MFLKMKNVAEQKFIWNKTWQISVTWKYGKCYAFGILHLYQTELSHFNNWLPKVHDYFLQFLIKRQALQAPHVNCLCFVIYCNRGVAINHSHHASDSQISELFLSTALMNPEGLVTKQALRWSATLNSALFVWVGYKGYKNKSLCSVLQGVACTNNLTAKDHLALPFLSALCSLFVFTLLVWFALTTVFYSIVFRSSRQLFWVKSFKDLHSTKRQTDNISNQMVNIVRPFSSWGPGYIIQELGERTKQNNLQESKLWTYIH